MAGVCCITASLFYCAAPELDEDFTRNYNFGGGFVKAEVRALVCPPPTNVCTHHVPHKTACASQ